MRQKPTQALNDGAFSKNPQGHFAQSPLNTANSFPNNAGWGKTTYPTPSPFPNHPEIPTDARYTPPYPQTERQYTNNYQGARCVLPYPQAERQWTNSYVNSPYPQGDTTQCRGYPTNPAETRGITPYPREDRHHPYDLINPTNVRCIPPYPQPDTYLEHNSFYPPWCQMNPSAWGACPWVMG